MNIAVETTTAVRAAQRPAIRAALALCQERCADIDGVIVSTVDGHSIEALLARPLASERLATMNCSLLALAETLAIESDQGLCRFLIVENTDGRVVLFRINRTLLLTCLSSLDSNLGMVHNVGQQTARAIAKALAV